MDEARSNEDKSNDDKSNEDKTNGEAESESTGARKPRPVRASTPPEGPGRKPPATESADSGDDSDQGTSRPTPVRELMRGGPGGADAWEPPSRSFEHEGREWVVTMVGQTVTGLPPDSGAPLMHLHFAPADAPDSPERELLTVGRELDPLYDEELRQLFDRSRALEGDG